MIAHVLSAARLASAAPFALLLGRALAEPGLSHASVGAAALLAFAIASDLADGAIARRRGGASAFGRALDHLADCAFVVAGLGAAAAQGALPWLLPALIALAFAQYALDSLLVHRSAELQPSRLGRANGVLYFALLGAATGLALGATGLAGALRAAAWLMVASTLLSMGERSLISFRRAPAGHGAGTPDRAPR